MEQIIDNWCSDTKHRSDFGDIEKFEINADYGKGKGVLILLYI
jgi:hypothetical protein